MSENLLSTNEWVGKALCGGWKNLRGGSLDVVEPATGHTLSRVAKANAQDVRNACMLARRAQKPWAALPYQARAAIFRKAATLLEASREAYSAWIVRETGGIVPKVLPRLISGPFLAALLLGVADVAGKYYVPAAGAFVIYSVMLVVLILRPHGLFAPRSLR